MALSWIEYEGLRNLQPLRLELAAETNWIFGANGSGKTAFLEAVYLLGRASSFRTQNIRQLIQFECSGLRVVADATHAHSQTPVRIGVAVSPVETRIHIDGSKAQNRAELAEIMPLQLIHPESYCLLDGPPKQRRQFMDWGVFHVEPAFFHAWQHYSRALKQRNAALKSGQHNQLDTWNHELMLYAELITEQRAAYVQRLRSYLSDVQALAGLSATALTLEYRPGWDNRQSFQNCLQTDLEKDLRYRSTQSGPHRADFSLRYQGKLARDYLSRGTLKLIVIGLRLVQVRMLHDISDGIKTHLLLDDLGSELDAQSLTRVFDCLQEFKSQKLITGLDKASCTSVSWPGCEMFHVEHGRIRPL